jgi:hypothetical protein
MYPTDVFDDCTRGARVVKQPVPRADPGATLTPMPFRPAAIPGAGSNHPGEIDYRLARQSLISEYRKGRLARHEVCDTHPELRRNAVACGSPTTRPCPICEGEELVLVTYVFGSRLPASGRCLSKRGELAAFAKRAGTYAAYVVEVCPTCWWNHLVRSFLVGRGVTATT